MRIHHLTCGCFCPMGGWLFGVNHRPFCPAQIPCHCLLIETPRGLVMVDTGLGRDDLKAFTRPRALPIRMILRPVLDESLTAAAQIQKLGYQPGDVRHIIMTHMDYDHAGGLADFPQTTIHVTTIEHHACVQRKRWIEKVRYIPGQIAHGPSFHLHAPQGDHWRGFASVQAIEGLDDDVLLIPLAGHTLGHCGVAVKQDDSRWLLHAGDAVIDHRELDPQARCPLAPKLMRAMTRMNRAAWRDNLHRLRELASHEDVMLTNAHDKAMMEGWNLLQ
jgi:glyoxylase-like metal-dependent hydrolase (beta-lactamase superfamily II)